MAGASVAASHGGDSVLLFGELLADVFPDRRVAGGAPFNVACHLAGFGAAPLLVSRLGRDEVGDFLLDAMRRFALDARLVQTDDRHGSGRVAVVRQGGAHQFEIPPAQAFDFIDAGELTQGLAGIPAPTLLYFGTLAQRNAASRSALQAMLAACDAPRFVDLNLRPPWVSREIVEASLDEATVVKLGEDELHSVGTWLPGGDTAAGKGDAGRGTGDQRLARRLARRHRIGTVVVTCGERGAWCLADDRIIEVPPAAVGRQSDGDTVGAGDAFSAVLILGMLAAWPLRLRLERASRFAAEICAIPGATPADGSFYTVFREDWRT